MSNFNHSNDHQVYHSNGNDSSYNYTIGGAPNSEQGQNDSCHFGIPLHHGTPHNMNPPLPIPATSAPATNVTASSSPPTYHGPSLMAHVTF